eukprot:Skav206290  [mRNA]  locus=scaffold922:347592:349910:- [translate_table: standard]
MLRSVDQAVKVRHLSLLANSFFCANPSSKTYKMVSASKHHVAAAAGAAALLGGASFVSVAPRGNLRANSLVPTGAQQFQIATARASTTSTSASSHGRVQAAHSTQTACLAMTGAAVAALSTAGRKATCDGRARLNLVRARPYAI